MNRTPRILALCILPVFASCAVFNPVPTTEEFKTAVEMPMRSARGPKPAKVFLAIRDESGTFGKPSAEQAAAAQPSEQDSLYDIRKLRERLADQISSDEYSIVGKPDAADLRVDVLVRSFDTVTGPEAVPAELAISPTIQEAMSGMGSKGTELVQRFATTWDGFVNLSRAQSSAKVLSTLLVVDVLVRSAQAESTDSAAPSSEGTARPSDVGVSRFVGTVIGASVTKAQAARMLLPRLAKALPSVLHS